MDLSATLPSADAEISITSDVAAVVVTTAQAAKILGLENRSIQRLSADGYVEPIRRGRWRLVDLIAGRERQRDEREKSSTHAAAASRATDARTREIEQRIALRNGDLIPRDEHEAILDLFTGRFIGSLSGLPAQITRDPAQRERIEQIVGIERERLADFFEEVADRAPARAKASDAG